MLALLLFLSLVEAPRSLSLYLGWHCHVCLPNSQHASLLKKNNDIVKISYCFVLLCCLIYFCLNNLLYLWHASSMSSVCGAFAMLDVHSVSENINLCSGCFAFKTSPAQCQHCYTTSMYLWNASACLFSLSPGSMSTCPCLQHFTALSCCKRLGIDTGPLKMQWSFKVEMDVGETWTEKLVLRLSM